MSDGLTDSYDDFDDEYDDGFCPVCDDEGVIERMVCPDDMCVGVGECMHGDGNVFLPCPRCAKPKVAG